MLNPPLIIVSIYRLTLSNVYVLIILYFNYFLMYCLFVRRVWLVCHFRPMANKVTINNRGVPHQSSNSTIRVSPPPCSSRGPLHGAGSTVLPCDDDEWSPSDIYKRRCRPADVRCESRCLPCQALLYSVSCNSYTRPATSYRSRHSRTVGNRWPFTRYLFFVTLCSRPIT